jgi:hypothetical protein
MMMGGISMDYSPLIPFGFGFMFIISGLLMLGSPKTKAFRFMGNINKLEMRHRQIGMLIGFGFALLFVASFMAQGV